MINSNLDQAFTYTEFSGLNALKAEAKHDKTAALETVSKQFEAMFISMITKSMREANKSFSEGNFLNSSQTEFYQQMYDSQMSLTLSQGRGIGLAESMMRQMSKQIDGVENSASENPLLHKKLSDYPRNLPVEKTVRKAVELVDAIVQIEDKIKSKVEAGQATDAQVDGDLITDDMDLATNDSPLVFASPDEFISHLYPMALNVEKETGISAKVMVAQSALETGWGQHMIETSSHEASFNLFGIKADARWKGENVEIVTTEYRDGIAMKEKANFRSYDNYEDSFRDYARFLQDNPRYEPAMQYLSNPDKFAEKLQDAGYATDPAYSKKIQRILNGELFKGAMNNANVLGGVNDG